MESVRFNALQSIKTNGIAHGDPSARELRKVSELFGENIFSLRVMQEYLTEGTYYNMVSALKHSTQVSMETAENVAKGLIKWATDRGATHYTHWFQPLTGSCAEKHDTFFKPSLDISVQGMEKLSASELVQREPDASSFPNGGLRSTAEARGYTVWDPSSPAFIKESKSGKTLYIPAIFISYTGESLDYKTPLLKSQEVLNRAATRVCHYFDDSVTNVMSTLGWEQEYFLVDEKLFNARPDLMLTGRSLFGSPSAKHQQMSDHYFAAIPDRIQDYMVEFERESLRLGIPIQTRHNEVAPGQYECAPMFEELNVAVDHNLLLMDLMERIARKHGLRVLFHEKPFAEINGSGKHNNWSLATGAGKNLLSPGKDPGNNLYFLTFFINVIKAIHEHAEVVRATIANSGNDHRLGANEAPPAIMSVFTGSLLEKVLQQFQEKGLVASKEAANPVIDLDIPRIPEAVLDNTDRNRTSPFPFTGNKFEFRAVGSSASCSFPMMALNTIVAHQLDLFAEEIDSLVEEKKVPQQEALVSVLKRYLQESQPVIFNGDGYTGEWEAEAQKRGLPNLRNTPEALQAFTSKKSKALFEKHKIFNSREVDARYQVLIEQYIQKLEVECRLMHEMVHTIIMPAAVSYQNRLSESFQGLKNMELDKAAEDVRSEVENLFNELHEIRAKAETMLVELERALEQEDLTAQAIDIAQKVKPSFEEVRRHADKLEHMVDDSVWKLPKYHELLFVK